MVFWNHVKIGQHFHKFHMKYNCSTKPTFIFKCVSTVWGWVISDTIVAYMYSVKCRYFVFVSVLRRFMYISRVIIKCKARVRILFWCRTECEDNLFDFLRMYRHLSVHYLCLDWFNKEKCLSISTILYFLIHFIWNLKLNFWTFSLKKIQQILKWQWVLHNASTHIMAVWVRTSL